MMSDAIGKMLKRKATTVPQTEPMEDEQVMNSTGGFVWEVDDLTRLRRFLCLGTDGGTYYVKEEDLTVDNAKSVISMIESGRGKELVAEVKAISVSGRAAKQNPTLFALALAARYPTETLDPLARRSVAAAAYEALPDIARIPTHLFTFVDYCQKVGPTSGWGRAHRSAIARWYLSTAPKDLAFSITKYPQRGGWSHRDLLRLSHARPTKAQSENVNDIDLVLAYATHGLEGVTAKLTKQGRQSEDSKAVLFLEAVEDLKKTEDPHFAGTLIANNGLVREHVPTPLLNNADIWKTLFPHMPITATIRNLPKMTNVGLLSKKSDATADVCARLRDENVLHKARVHPYSILLAHETYKSGHGDKGKQTWEAVPSIVNALNDAFYLSFKNVPSTGKRYLVALDVSGSMSGANILGSSITARVASAAMSLIHLRTETAKVDFVAFTSKLIPLDVQKKMTLDQLVTKVSRMQFGATDCALPMEYARKKAADYDVFVVYTDSETYHGKVHPAEALRKYRRERVRDARLIVVGMTATKFSIADPLDPGMLDIAGFDAAAPELMRNFVLGHI